MFIDILSIFVLFLILQLTALALLSTIPQLKHNCFYLCKIISILIISLIGMTTTIVEANSIMMNAVKSNVEFIH